MSISRYSNRWHSTNVFSVVLVSIIVHFAGSQGQDPCNRYGQYCAVVSNCSSAAELINNRKALQCGYQNREVKICCNRPRSPNPPQWNPTTVRPQAQAPVVPPAAVAPPIPVPVAPQTPVTTPPLPAPPPMPVTFAPATSSSIRPPAQAVTSATSKPKPDLPPQNSFTSIRFKNATATALLNCEEYAKYRYRKRWFEPVLVGSQGYWHTELDCVHTLISGGAPAAPKEFPHMALIGYGNDFKDVQWSCGGSLISDRFVLSAAHCGPPRWALLGDLNITSKYDSAKPAVYRIVKVYDHPNYKPPSYYNDISLFELNTTVAMSPFVRPACLLSLDSGAASKLGIISGWGATGHGYRQSDHLLKAEVSVMNEERCKDSYDGQNDVRLSQGFDTTTMMCAGDYTGIKDTCSGDSGGPLQTLMDNEKYTCMWTIFGVTSFGKICGNIEEPEPGVYTKVAHYLDWIQPIVWP